MEDRTIKRYRKITVWFHWLHSAAFVVLVLTGALVFLPGTMEGKEGPSIAHRVFGVFFIGIPIIYCFYDSRKALQFVKETFTWDTDDTKWLKTAPKYYFGSSDENTPPQGYINTGQKIWQQIILITGIIFLITGAMMWFFESSLAIQVYQWILFVHGLAFIIVFTMFLIHVYMGILHPMTRGSHRSMLDGKVSPQYARSHYRKWYDELQKIEEGADVG